MQQYLHFFQIYVFGKSKQVQRLAEKHLCIDLFKINPVPQISHAEAWIHIGSEDQRKSTKRNAPKHLRHMPFSE